jgi:hypothetical protein
MIIDMSVTLFTGCVRLSPPTCTSLFAGFMDLVVKKSDIDMDKGEEKRHPVSLRVPPLNPCK